MYLPPSPLSLNSFFSPSFSLSLSLGDHEHLHSSQARLPMRSKNKPSAPPFSLHYCAQEDRKCKCERRERNEITLYLICLFFSTTSEYFHIFHAEEKIITFLRVAEIDRNVCWQISDLKFRPLSVFPEEKKEILRDPIGSPRTGNTFQILIAVNAYPVPKNCVPP